MIRHHHWREEDQAVVDAYHEVAYRTERFAHTTWKGHEVWKFSEDLLIYAELLHRVQPTVVIEAGRYQGGSALFFADNSDAVVVSIDITPPEESAHPLPTHDRILWLTGSSVDPTIVTLAREVAEAHPGPVFVVLDSDHTAPHVLAEMGAYGPLVTPGSYLVVEDTNLNGHPVLPEWGPGPWEAVQEWLPAHPEFTPDPACERFLLTSNPAGWLLRS